LGFTGFPGTQGPQGPQGAEGATGTGLVLLETVSFGALPQIQTYNVPAGTTLLFIRLWGAGGGGAGAANSNVSADITAVVGGGGAGGGYAEAFIENPPSLSYDFFLATGGAGGVGYQTGRSADLSWFSDPAHLQAEGGEGGSSVTAIQPPGGFAFASGAIEAARGGESRGTMNTLALSGSAGEPPFARRSTSNTVIAVGGMGGASATASGSSASGVARSRIAVSATVEARNGQAGNSYGGGGGGGAVSLTQSTGAILTATGGAGADAHLEIEAYGNP
jgi:hypothetical protein